jgi:hypothetical protein
MKNLNFKVILLFVVIAISFSFCTSRVASKSFAESYPMLTVSCDELDFGRCTRDSNPSMKFIISNFYIENGDLQGILKSSTNWIKLSDTSFTSNSTEITVQLDLSKLPLNLYKEKIEIETNAGNLHYRFE